MTTPAPSVKRTPAELLARAEALMRKNRALEEDLPVLDTPVGNTELVSESNSTAQWERLRETVYSSVMQQLDLYAQFGLKERIGRDLRLRLQEWSDKAAADLAKEMSDQIRHYVAQAIDEEVVRQKNRKNP